MHAVAYGNIFHLSSWPLDRLAAIGHLHSDGLFLYIIGIRLLYHNHKSDLYLVSE